MQTSSLVVGHLMIHQRALSYNADTNWKCIIPWIKQNNNNNNNNWKKTTKKNITSCSYPEAKILESCKSPVPSDVRLNFWNSDPFLTESCTLVLENSDRKKQWQNMKTSFKKQTLQQQSDSATLWWTGIKHEEKLTWYIFLILWTGELCFPCLYAL